LFEITAQNYLQKNWKIKTILTYNFGQDLIFKLRKTKIEVHLIFFFIYEIMNLFIISYSFIRNQNKILIVDT
jgi:hypothetical protein